MVNMKLNGKHLTGRPVKLGTTGQERCHTEAGMKLRGRGSGKTNVDVDDRLQDD
jgi:hypothetical protein